MANNADNIIGDFAFVTGTNAQIPAWVFLDLQPLVVPVADTAPPQPDELDVADVAYIHSSQSHSLVVLGVQQVSSPFDFAQRVLVDPASYPHITAVHFSYSLYFSQHGWVYVSTRVFNTLLGEWVITDGSDQTVVWYQMAGGAIDDPVVVGAVEGGLEEVEHLLDPFGDGMAAHVPDELWEELDEDDDGGYATDEAE